jgi:signal transduction histidine kinase
MDETTLSRAFTPFFSAQKAGRRRGLGLPMAWRYVACNRGRIWLESQPGEGTTAHVVLPAGE